MPKPLFSHLLTFQSPHQPGTFRQSIAAATDTILPDDTVLLTNTSGGSITFTSTPTVLDGHDGDRALLVNVSANDLVLKDQGTLANSNLRLATATLTLSTRDSLWLLFSAAIGDWLQIGQTNVI